MADPSLSPEQPGEMTAAAAAAVRPAWVLAKFEEGILEEATPEVGTWSAKRLSGGTCYESCLEIAVQMAQGQ